MIDAVICIPSFKRPKGLERTLASLVAQTYKNFAVVVVDNDAVGREATPVAQAFFDMQKLQGEVICEPKQGNVNAINAVFAYALAKYPDTQNFLMIDDDEFAAPNWLEEMLKAQSETQAELVGGPVTPVFEEANTPYAQHPAFWPAFEKSGFVYRIFGSGNCLITRKVFEQFGHAPFDVAFNHLGGGDADFFMRATQVGFKSYYTQAALIEEVVPRERTTRKWLIARCLRIGALNVLVEQKRLSKMTTFLKTFLWFGIAFKRSFEDFMRTKSVFIAANHLIIAFGRFLPFLNLLPQPYKA